MTGAKTEDKELMMGKHVAQGAVGKQQQYRLVHAREKL